MSTPPITTTHKPLSLCHLGMSQDTRGALEERGTHSVLPDPSAGLAGSASLRLASHLQSKGLLQQRIVNQKRQSQSLRTTQALTSAGGQGRGNIARSHLGNSDIFQTVEQRREQGHPNRSESCLSFSLLLPQGKGRGRGTGRGTLCPAAPTRGC